VAFVGGIDLCHGRNDDEHHRGDPQAIELDERFGSTPAWHDIQVEIRGAAVGDIAETFRERWNDPSPLSRIMFGRRSAPDGQSAATFHHFPTCRTGAVGGHTRGSGPSNIPVKRPRYPFAPYGERSIARAYLKAFQRARRLIYIEDQYLWSADIARCLGRALQKQRASRWWWLFRGFPRGRQIFGTSNRIGQVSALRRLRKLGGSRFVVYDLERDRLPVYVHAKICIVDDVWMTVGSDNLNRRSWTHDSELSCAVLDDEADRREPADSRRTG